VNWRSYVGRFSVEFELANHKDVVQAKMGSLTPEQVRRQRNSGVVDTGAAGLVLPASVVAAPGFPDAGQVTVKFADGRRDKASERCRPFRAWLFLRGTQTRG
jgi:hypothetical protein